MVIQIYIYIYIPHPNQVDIGFHLNNLACKKKGHVSRKLGRTIGEYLICEYMYMVSA